MKRTLTTAFASVMVVAVLAGCSSADAATGSDAIPSDATNGEVSDRIDQAGHQFRNVDEATAPTIDVALLEDPMGGWNLRVDTSNFQWAPERVSTEAVPGEGHAHVFVGNKKVARIYGPWFYVNPSILAKGKNTVTVTLNANDHTTYAIDDVQITDSVTIDSSGEGDGHAGHSH